MPSKLECLRKVPKVTNFSNYIPCFPKATSCAGP